jgi:hypothetical protein
MCIKFTSVLLIHPNDIASYLFRDPDHPDSRGVPKSSIWCLPFLI